MFKLIPLVVSLAVAGSGAVALSTPKVFNADFNNSTNASVDQVVYTQNDSDLFLNAQGNSGLNANVNTDNTSADISVESGTNVNLGI